MQLMTWPFARLGSRFGLLFEPYRRRIMHSSLGRFMDRPLDLAVGFIEPDGTERVMPFTKDGEVFYGCEQFERINSITYRGYSERLGLQFELNFHSPFYPQNEELCVIPAIYVELRVSPIYRVRWSKKAGDEVKADKIKLFIRLNRADTDISVSDGKIDMEYDVPLDAHYQRLGSEAELIEEVRNDGGCRFKVARVCERIQSLNDGAVPIVSESGGQGLTLELPVTEVGSGIKWRMVWATHTSDPIMEVDEKPAKLRYLKYWSNLDEVMDAAISSRDENLAHSRRFERLIEQAPFSRARWHLLVLGFQGYLANTFWCDVEEGDGGGESEWFSNWEGSCLFQSTVDVEYNVSLIYFAMWPDLLKKTMKQWSRHGKAHEQSGGLILSHDMGIGLAANGQSYPHDMPVEENANFLLLLETYIHWTGDCEPIEDHVEFVRRLADYLLWTDRDGSGFPSEGVANTIDDATPAVQYARKQTYLAVKRVTALQSAASLFDRIGESESAERYRNEAAGAIPKIESAAWIGDHYAVCVDVDAAGLVDVWTGEPLPYDKLPGWDDYSIYTANGLLLPEMIGRQSSFDRDRMVDDMSNSIRETLTPYGCSHSSSDITNVWISQNLWRDHTGRYIGVIVPSLENSYWDLEAYSNTGGQSFGFIDTYVGNELCFYPRGATAFGYFLAGPRIRIDRLTDDEKPRITISPDRFRNSRWPLLPLADWKAGKIPVCVVDGVGNISIEGEIEPVVIKTK